MPFRSISIQPDYLSSFVGLSLHDYSQTAVTRPESLVEYSRLNILMGIFISSHNDQISHSRHLLIGLSCDMTSAMYTYISPSSHHSHGIAAEINTVCTFLLKSILFTYMKGTQSIYLTKHEIVLLLENTHGDYKFKRIVSALPSKKL